MAIPVRLADVGEVDQLARIWYQAWRDAHVGLVPTGLVELRSLEDFTRRLPEFLPEFRVAGPPGAAVGFCALKDDELEQLFVVAAARATGVAAALLADGEARLHERGVATARLTCVIGNHRAARFYEKHGWTRTGTEIGRMTSASATFEVPLWRYEKRLRGYI